MKLVRRLFADCAKASCSKLRPNILLDAQAQQPPRTRSCRRVEHYWLGDACSPYVTLTFDQGRGVASVPLADGSGKKTVRVVSLESSNEVAEGVLQHERDAEMKNVNVTCEICGEEGLGGDGWFVLMENR